MSAWEVGAYDAEGGRYHYHAYEVRGEGGYLAALVADENDARLIAAAPEMAALLADVLYDINNEGFVSNDTAKRIHERLARIQGEAPTKEEA